MRARRPPRWSLCGRDAPLPGGLSSRAVVPPPRAWPKAALMAVTTIKSTDLLAGGRIRARWRSWHVTGWRRSPKCCGGLLFVFGGASTRERGRPARILIPANSLPSKATPLQGAPNPPLRGSLPSCLFPSCRGLCGRDARAPGWSLCGRDARAPGWSLCGRNDARAPGWARLCGPPDPGIHLGARASPASLSANSLPSKATPLQRAPNPPFYGFSSSCRVVFVRADARAPRWGLCGRDARAPGWSLCGRDARAPRWGLLLPPARPLAGPSRASSNALVALWPFFVPLRG